MASSSLVITIMCHHTRLFYVDFGYQTQVLYGKHLAYRAFSPAFIDFKMHLRGWIMWSSLPSPPVGDGKVMSQKRLQLKITYEHKTNNFVNLTSVVLVNSFRVRQLNLN